MGGERGNEGRLMYWPLIPSYEKSMKLSYSTMNAKVERLRESRTYGRLLQNRRCVIPVDGFYEFAGEKGAKIPWFVYLKSKEPFSLADFGISGKNRTTAFSIHTSDSTPGR